MKNLIDFKAILKIAGIVTLSAVFALSMMSCDEPLDEECEHDWDIWTQVGTTAEGNRECLKCAEVQTLAKGNFEGKWTAPVGGVSQNTQVVEISGGNFEIYNVTSAGVKTSDGSFKVTATTWTARANDTSATGALAKANYPVGFRITGTYNVEGTTWAGNNRADVYMGQDGTKIAIRLTDSWGTREYVFTVAQ